VQEINGTVADPLEEVGGAREQWDAKKVMDSHGDLGKLSSGKLT